MGDKKVRICTLDYEYFDLVTRFDAGEKQVKVEHEFPVTQVDWSIIDGRR